MKHCRWGDICSLEYGKALLDYSAESSERDMFRVFGTNGQIGWTSTPLCRNAGIIIGRKGAYRGVHFSPEPFFVIDTAYYLRLATDDINLKWAYYKLLTVDINRMDVGAAIPTTNRNEFYALPLSVPSFDKQVKVSNALSAYDDLIDINRRRIQLLEEAARLLFREWFVYFRFPGHEKINIVDGVPEGWEKKILVEIANITMGQSPKSENYNDEGIGLPFHQGVTGFGDRFPNTQTYCTQNNRIALYGDILFSVRAPVGRLNISIEKIIIGRGLSAIRSKDNHQSFLFYNLKNHFFKEDMIGGGAIFAAITKSDLENVSLLYPDKKIIEKFENISNPIDKQIENLSIQNQKLAQARDLLLPRLMSGKIEV